MLAPTEDPIALIDQWVKYIDCALQHPRPLPSGKHAYRKMLSANPAMQELYHSLYAVYAEEKSAAPFCEPVNALELQAPTYYTVVSRPASLRTVLDNIVADKYKDAAEAEDDVALVWENCRRFNGADSELAGQARLCERALERRREAYRDDKPATDDEIDAVADAIEQCNVHGLIAATTEVTQYLRDEDDDLLIGDDMNLEKLKHKHVNRILAITARHLPQKH